MSSFEEQFEKATEARDIPGVVLIASDAKGKFKHQAAFGPRTPAEKINLDTTFILASCTKLMTSIAALQCVERGLIGLDDDVSSVLTELKGRQILTGFKESSGEPEYKKAENPITLRQLLTHSSGFGYDAMAPEYMKWRAFRGEAPGTRGMALKDRVSLPLLYEPGTSWSYGISTDLAGELVGRLNNTTLEEFMEKNIWTPLGIKNITSHQERKPDVKKNLVKMTSRGVVENAALGFAARTEAKVEWTDEPVYDDPTVDEYGGAGGIGSAVEYIKILDSILADDGKLLKSETIDLALTPQLTGGAEQAVNGFLGAPFSAGAFSSKKPGTKFNYGLAGGLVMDDVKGSLRSRTMTWSGLPNLLWTIDRKAGLTLFYASNILPFGDYKSAEFQQLFEKEIYARFERSKVAT